MTFACYSLKTAPGSGGPDGDPAEGDDPTGDHPDDPGSDADSGKKTSGPDAGDFAVCTPELCPQEVLLDGLYGPVTIALDDTHYYWVEAWSEIPDGGGKAQLLRLPKELAPCKHRSCVDLIDDGLVAGELESSFLSYLTLLEAGPSHVCVAQTFNNAQEYNVHCYPKPGFTRTLLQSGNGVLTDLWLGPTDVWWAVRADHMLRSKGAIVGKLATAKETTEPTTYAEGLTGPSGVTSDGSTVYFTELGEAEGQGSVSAVEHGKVRELSANHDVPISPRVFGHYVYWIDDRARKVLRAPVDGTGPTELIATTDEGALELAVDETGVYWASTGPFAPGVPAPHGSVAHAPLTPGGETTVMLRDLRRVTDIAVDATHVYVTTAGDEPFEQGKIIRVKKGL